MSPFQHQANAHQHLIIPAEGNDIVHGGRNHDWWNTLAGDQSRKNYIEGMMLVAQSEAGRFLLNQPNNFYSMKQFSSRTEMTF